ncbi:monofunctional biosynthetic peptidoglycan transglycosylase [Yoonia sediminilitoris]|uniref:Biosynthetic peptidoglycan transglycosylase n=1 Tax=Yoonia sediminilitoris TaxID=1286148 RepID=A0A2T6KLA7_9RHOB|nr:monofunctional biosynthetic peptidoglycan transglycosylase [Yoonia sediminilitoris]PUB16999.1 monofunctional biosynthetic peptidoglycan transglycosylase [Yoonia sediminilitoris]RCW97294.1 monofunctional biosynthetic peptidoglycan transglycosylase [Yoonia sediminilitoris]
MAERSKKKSAKKTATRKSAKNAKKAGLLGRFWRFVRRLVWGAGFAALGFVLLATLLYALIAPPTTPYMYAEGRRLGAVKQVWVPMDRIAPVMARSAVAAEDANFCLHWGLDVKAIRAAIERGRGGASTISQQVIKNVYLWHGRSWSRKAIEAVWTPLAEAVWTKRRILELYLNVAEFDEGVFGVQAAARHYFGINAIDLSATQAARLAAILPAPKNRSASNPSQFVRNRTRQIISGAETIRADGRAACFEA